MTMQRVYKLNAAGIAAAKKWLAEARKNPNRLPPQSFLTASGHTNRVAPEVYVESRDFANRREAGAYLSQQLKRLSVEQIADDAGLWSWLGMFYFEQVVARNARGQRRISKSDVPYVIDPTSSGRGDTQRHRNRLYAAWDIYTRHGDERARGLLSQPVSGMEHLADRLLGALEAYRSPGVMDLANRLYTNPVSGQPKPGIAGGGGNLRPAGGVVRLLDVLNQLYMTYDVYGMKAEQLLGLLPAEFEQWRP